MKIKENDVFHAHWKDRSISNHCFEGLLTAKLENCPAGSGEQRVILVDNFWRSGGNKWFTLDEAEKQLNIQYYCNLDDYDLSVSVKTAPLYYEDSDYIFMHDQHACVESCKYFYLKKGAEKSKSKMLKSINDRIEESRRKIKSLEGSIEWLEKDALKVEAGDLQNIWI